MKEKKRRRVDEVEGHNKHSPHAIRSHVEMEWGYQEQRDGEQKQRDGEQKQRDGEQKQRDGEQKQRDGEQKQRAGGNDKLRDAVYSLRI
jgi:hypothetical protein